MKKYLKAIMIVSVLVFGLSLMAQNRPAPAEKAQKPAPAAQARLERLKNWLNLTPEQVTKLNDLRKAQAEEQRTFRQQLQKLRGEIGPLLKDPKADQAKINALVDQITKLAGDRIKKSLQNGKELEKIFTPEQFQKFRQLRNRPAPQRFMRGRGMGPMAMGPRGQFMPQGQFMQPGPRGQFMGPRMGRGMMPWRFQGRGWRMMRRSWFGLGIWW
jgi:Spy/CpxP family protein refolding chaperone